MATTTPNLTLRKPASTDLVNVTTDISDNMDILDSPDYSASAAGDDVITSQVDGDTQKRFILNANGKMEWGSGAAVTDTFLERSAAGSLRVGSGNGTLVNHRIIRKTADESVVSSVALQADNELTFAIAAFEEWEFEFVVFMDEGGGGIKFAVDIPASANMRVTVIGNGLQQVWTTLALTTIRSYPSIDPAGESFIVKGIVIGGAGAGSVSLYWAQDTSNASATIVKADSYLKAHRIA